MVGLNAKAGPADGKLDAPAVILVVGPPKRADQVAGDQRDADGRDQESDRTPASQSAVDGLVDDDRDRGAADHRCDQSDGERQAETKSKEQRKVSPERHHVAVSEIGKVEDPVSQREPDGSQDDDAPKDESVDGDLRDLDQTVIPPKTTDPPLGFRVGR